MRAFDPVLAEIRFGYGLSPNLPAPRDVKQLLAGLTGPDDMAELFAIEPFSIFRGRMVKAQAARAERRKYGGTERGDAARKRHNVLNKETREAWYGWVGQSLLRRSHSPTAFRERVIAFWADHFTARGKASVIRRGTTPYIEEAIRPFIALRFADLLQATVMHPLMLDYLDQARSIGPGSNTAERQGGKRARGLNENLAREVLELHTLGVDGPYTQTDVTQLAELFTGMTFEAKNGYKFRKDFVEPGSETVLGQTYSDGQNDKPIRAALNDLAAHPSTARHIAWKLAVHFTKDDPDTGLVDTLEAIYLQTDGDLMALYEALLTHPASWTPELINFKPPIDFMSSSFRALAPPAKLVGRMEPGQRVRHFMRPLVTMGQAWETPGGPDGWPEEDDNWITPQGLAARVTWAMNVPETILRVLPDPRQFVDTALGSYANDAVHFAAGAAESKAEAIGLVLMSPAFQRR